MNSPHHILVYAPENERFETTLEHFAEEVSGWPGLYFEMDGSFVWAIRDQGSAAGQIDGMIYDRNDAIEYLDLKGHAPIPTWEKLFRVLLKSGATWDVADLRIFDVSAGMYLSWSHFSDIMKREG